MSNKLVKKPEKKNEKTGVIVLGTIAALILVAVIVILFVIIGKKDKGTTKKNVAGDFKANSEIEKKINDGQLSGKHHVVINVKDYGEIKCELDADVAPISVTNFVKLANSGFYNGLTFHRIIAGFMIQGGDPNHDGTGGSKETIKGEFKNNGVENNISHKRGVISMARSNANDSASSQFFIVNKDSKSLDGSYAAFGEVTSGMDVVDSITEDAKPTDSNGTIPYDQQPVINFINVID